MRSHVRQAPKLVSRAFQEGIFFSEVPDLTNQRRHGSRMILLNSTRNLRAEKSKVIWPTGYLRLFLKPLCPTDPCAFSTSASWGPKSYCNTNVKQVSEPVTWNWTWDYSGLVDNFITSLLKRNYNELVQWLFMLKIPRHSITYRFTARFKPIFQVLFLKVKTHKNDAVLVNFVCGAILLCSGRGRSGNGGAI